MDSSEKTDGTSVALAADTNLDALLQQALEEFERPVLLPSEKIKRSTVIDSSGTSFVPAAVSECQQQDNSCPKNDYLINTAKEIDDALSEISHDDPALAAQLKKLTECAVAVGSGDEDVAMKNFSQFASMFKDTLSQLSAQAGDGQDDLMDDDLTSIMSSLDKLGISDPPCEGSEDSELSSLRDITRTLLSKDLLYEPLKEAKKELQQWLREKGSTPSHDERQRHESQLSCIESLVCEYEANSHDMNSKSEDVHFRKLLQLTSQLEKLGELPKQLKTHASLNALYSGIAEEKDNAGKTSDVEVAPPNCSTT